MFKFKKGDKVVIETGKMFASVFLYGGFASTTTTEPSKITACREHNGINQYKVKGFTCWADEKNLQEVK